MRIKEIKFMQQGGAMAAPEATPAAGTPEMSGAPQGGAEEQIMQMAAQLIQEIGPEAAMMLAQAIMQLLQEGQGQPTFKRGGKLAKKACGSMKVRK